MGLLDRFLFPCCLMGNTTVVVPAVLPTITVTWTAVSGATDYFLEVGSALGLADVRNIDTGSTATSYVLTVSSSGTYYVRVRAVVGGVEQGPSSPDIILDISN